MEKCVGKHLHRFRLYANIIFIIIFLTSSHAFRTNIGPILLSINCLVWAIISSWFLHSTDRWAQLHRWIWNKVRQYRIILINQVNCFCNVALQCKDNVTFYSPRNVVDFNLRIHCLLNILLANSVKCSIYHTYCLI